MHESFLALTLLTLGAAGLAWMLSRLRLSPILGYLLLGIVAGPFKSHLLPSPDSAGTVAEFAVVLLMFFIGLEFHLDQMRSMLRLCLGGGSVQVLLTAALAAGGGYMLGLSPLGAAVLGAMVAFSSTALVMKAFEDRRESDSQRARTALAVLLLQDIAAILAVAALPLAAGMSADAGEAGGHGGHGAPPGFGQIALLFVVLPILFFTSRYLLPRVFAKAAAARLPEAFSLLSLGACFSVALAAQWAGASMALGAFLGGLVLCQTPFASQILADLGTLRNLALAFFFVTIGMLVDVRFVADNAAAFGAALLALLAVKVAAAGIAFRLFQVPYAVAAGASLAMAQIGEFSFVLGQQAQALHILDGAAYQFILALAVASMLITPFLVNQSGAFGRWIAARMGSPELEAPPPQAESAAGGKPAAPHAIVVGYGPVGRTLARILKDFGIQPTIIDANIETVKKLTERGMPAIFGDAGRHEILQHAGVEKAAYLLVTLPDLPGRIPVVATAHMLNPELKIFVRARYLAERSMLEEAGATGVSYEEAEVAVALAKFLLRDFGADEEKIGLEARRIRGEIAIRTGFTMIAPAVRKPKPPPAAAH